MTNRSADFPDKPANRALARRSLLTGGLGLAALAATPAEACSLVATSLYPRSFFNDGRARIYLESLLVAANSAEPVPHSQQPPFFEIVEGDRIISSREAREWLVSNGRRDTHPAMLAGMTRIGRRPRRLIYAVALQRRQYLLAREGNGCDAGHEEGFRDDLQSWLYVFAPDGVSTLQRLPSLDGHVFALVDGVRFTPRNATA